jgi:homoserine kinase
MTLKDRMLIKVPASTANLGPGFDSIGLAVDLYLTLEVELNSSWEFVAKTKELKQFPSDEQHFICQVAKQVAAKSGKNLHPCKVTLESDIPLTRGLGSSAAAIVAGIELADAVGNLEMTKHEKLLFATELEGHPDNAGASLYGGLVIGCYQQNQVDMISIPNLSMEMVAVIPQEELQTKVARDVLPDIFPYLDAIKASSTANLLVGALLSENWDLAGKMMEQDLFHQPYRRQLIPFYNEIENSAKANGAFGVALSGAGPTVLCFTKEGLGMPLVQLLKQEFPMMDVKLLNIENKGSSVCRVEKIVG